MEVAGISKWADGPMRIPQTHKKKKCPKTPFYFYMVEQRDTLISQGHQISNMEELSRAAFPSWKEMQNDPEQMEKYIQLHKEWKKKEKFNLENKFDCFGRSLADIQKEAEKIRKANEEQDRNIKNTVEYGKRKGHLLTTSFFIGYFNTLCVTEEGFHIPCEAAVVEYSVAKGVDRLITFCLSGFQNPYVWLVCAYIICRPLQALFAGFGDLEFIIGFFRWRTSSSMFVCTMLGIF